MPTDNRRVATYLPKEINDRFTAFKNERGIKGDSQALIVILSEFLGVSQQVSHQVDSGLTQRVEILENKLIVLKDELLSELTSKLLLMNIQIQPTNDSLSELLEEETSLMEARTQTEIPNGVDGELLDKEVSPVESSELPETENNSTNDSLTDTSSDLSSELLDKEISLVESSDSPISILDEPLKNDLLPSLPSGGGRKRGRPKVSGVSTDGMLSTGELAKRLGVSSSSLSHWKPGGRREKSPEGILKATRKEDPEGIGWIFVPEVNHFRPEREPSSSSPEVLQSELLESE